MKKLLFTLFAVLILQAIFSQEYNGEIVSTENDVTVIKVWGTHAERGYAQGRLLAQEVADLWGYYFRYNHYASNYAAAKSVLTSPGNFSIPTEYIEEAEYLLMGVDDAGVDITGLDKWDVLLMSAFLDIDGILGSKGNNGPGCSTLISWDAATSGTSLDGKSIATRMTDWAAETGIIGNDVIVIHIPSEADEQPWVNVGYAGIIAPLSAMNQGGLGVFGQILLSSGSDHGTGTTGQNYEPTWFTIRQAVEKADYNNDGFNDVNDIKDANLNNTNGYADGFIYTAVSKYTSDDKTALIAEMAATTPYMTHRTNAFSDQIPGSNIYSANDQIKRNNNLDYCVRYNSVISNIGTGENFSATSHWSFMESYSNSWTMLTWDNIQMMQYIPEDQTLTYASHNGSSQAYQAPTLTLNLNDYFPQTPPSIIASTSTLNFGVTEIGTSSTISYTITGANLTDDITVSVSGTGFEISDNGTNFGTNSIVLAQSGGNIDAQIWVKFTPSASQYYSGNIAHSSTGSSDVNISLIGDTPTDLLVTKDETIKLFPNPTNGIITIEGNSIENIQITDITGKLVKQVKTYGANSITIDLSTEPKGIYFAKITCGKQGINITGYKTTKLIII